MREKDSLKRIIYNRNSDVYFWHMFASWACEVTLILIQKRPDCIEGWVVCGTFYWDVHIKDLL